MVNNISRMTLGTVQLGMNYGIANDLGMPDEQKSFSMLSAALQNGVTSLDTARNYGVSELVIGKFLKSYEGELPYITSKIKVTPDEEVDIEKHVITSAEESLERLGLKKVDCFLVHNVKDMFRYGESLAAAMSLLVKKGYGASKSAATPSSCAACSCRGFSSSTPTRSTTRSFWSTPCLRSAFFARSRRARG